MCVELGLFSFLVYRLLELLYMVGDILYIGVKDIHCLEVFCSCINSYLFMNETHENILPLNFFMALGPNRKKR